MWDPRKLRSLQSDQLPRAHYVGLSRHCCFKFNPLKHCSHMPYFLQRCFELEKMRATLLLLYPLYVLSQLGTDAAVLDALQNLFHLAGGPMWKNNTGWIDRGTDSCRYFGVACRDSYISSLSLTNNNLSGTLDGSWTSSFANLTSLDVSLNHLGGRLSDGLSALSSLSHLNVSYNQFYRAIPNLTQNYNLTLLDAGGNELNGSLDGLLTLLPSSIQSLILTSNAIGGSVSSQILRLSNIQTIDLSQNQLSGSVIDLSTLLHLRVLKLSYNAIYNLGPIYNESLTSLHLDWNRLRVPLSTFTHYGNLQTLHVSNCGLTGSMDGLQQLTSLVSLDVSLNRLSGYLPNFSGVPGLTYLNVSETYVKGSLDSLSSNSNLLTLDAFRCSLTGSLLPLQNSSLIQHLDLGHNLMKGTLPDFLGNLTSLVYISLSYNNFQGPILSSLLQHLDLSGNLLSGSLPLLWGRSLQHIGCKTNQLTGTLPEDLFDIGPQLRQVIIGSNSFSGEISSNFSKLSGLQFIDLVSRFKFLENSDVSTDKQFLYRSHNLFSGEIPTFLCNYPQFDHLDISVNNVESVIPPCLGSVASLTYLDMSYNYINGSIPNTFSQLTQISYLNLGSNFLQGDIQCLMSLPLLQVLDVSYNGLSGSLTDEIANLLLINALIFTSNRFTGELPQALSAIPTLQTLKIAYNGFTGAAPGYSPYLLEIYAANNSFEYIPKDAYDTMYSVITIDMSYNQLTGPLPDAKGLYNVQYISMRSNQLSGYGLAYWSTGFLYTTYLDLSASDNALNGLLPTVIASLIGLNYLNISHNQFSGGINFILPNPVLSQLDLSHNYFTGRLPTAFPPQLRVFSANGNLLSGSIDPSLADCSLIETIDLSNNYLSGRIPPEFGRLSRLSSLNLTSNLLTGAIPREVGALRSLSVLDLSNNQLEGEVPAILSDPNVVDLHENFFVGSLDWLSNIGTSLSDNMFSGQVPISTVNLKLVHLNVSRNQLEGTMMNLGSAKLLSTVDISHNRFQGQISSLPLTIEQIIMNDNQLQFADDLIVSPNVYCDLSGNNFQCPIPSSVRLNCQHPATRAT
ncbi:putative leucine-rich repeat receptor-like protein kinase [Planoprotostelium fungivorum]|uniref:Putative leucine-rich repeat receptor-like protein kinase n=1 Tax=Planoprotostelium fungivorum TaxID=1890364 RepID=A0A2P6NX11_9EUKA|nr:putative leucine-rich repeat receptor-like protein kinase [Planoprotostelium fungivorum]